MPLDPRKAFAIELPEPRYPLEPPYSPSEIYPESPFKGVAPGPSNLVYAGVRKLFFTMGLDRAHFGTAEWNPLGDLIKPGQQVVLKPNLVIHFQEYGGSIVPVITHGSLIRAVVDFVWIALKGQGRITIGDAPLQTADFEKLKQLAGLNELQQFYQKHLNFPLQIVDFRRYRSEKGFGGVVTSNQQLGGDQTGSQAVRVNGKSAHAAAGKQTAHLSAAYFNYRVTNYDPNEMQQHHNQETHEYLIANSILSADVIIGLPKLKTHRKAGLTCAMKNMVGINANKDWLPHHTMGAKQEGGDEYLEPCLRKRWASALDDRIGAMEPSLATRLLFLVRRGISSTRYVWPFPDSFGEGSWYGNNTLWRTINDLNRILMFADSHGQLQNIPQRRILHIVDGIVAGEGEGPLGPDPKPCGVLLAGEAAPVVDALCAGLMGFDPARMPTIKNAFGDTTGLLPFSLNEIALQSDDAGLSGPLRELKSFAFRPAAGWRGHIER